LWCDSKYCRILSSYFLNLRYKYHLGVVSWVGVKDSLAELGRKTTLDFEGESRDKNLVLTKKKKEFIEK
jgi:hypothetical protein